jgi:hypothetical protein
LLAFPEGERQAVARDVAARNLTVRAVEAMAKRARTSKDSDASGADTGSKPCRDLSIQADEIGSYEVKFHFKEKAELESAIRELRRFSSQLAG